MTSKPKTRATIRHRKSRDLWQRLHEEYTFSPSERHLVEVLVLAHQQIFQAEEQIYREGMILRSDKGIPRRHPCCEVIKMASVRFLGAWRTLALDGQAPDLDGKY